MCGAATPQRSHGPHCARPPVPWTWECLLPCACRAARERALTAQWHRGRAQVTARATPPRRSEVSGHAPSFGAHHFSLLHAEPRSHQSEWAQPPARVPLCLRAVQKHTAQAQGLSWCFTRQAPPHPNPTKPGKPRHTRRLVNTPGWSLPYLSLHRGSPGEQALTLPSLGPTLQGQRLTHLPVGKALPRPRRHSPAGRKALRYTATPRPLPAALSPSSAPLCSYDIQVPTAPRVPPPSRGDRTHGGVFEELVFAIILPE